MARYLYANNARSTLLGNIGPTDPTITLPNGEGARFPMPSAGYTFLVTIEDTDGNIEIVECTARTADTLTVTRGREGTLARTFLASTPVEMRVTAGMLGQIDWTAFAGVANGVATLDGDAKLPIAQFDTPLQVYGDARWNPNLGFTPPQQGGGAGQGTNKVYIGWVAGTSTLNAQVDANNLGALATQSWVTGTAAAKSATQLTTARTLALTGPVTGSASFNGAANANIATAIAAGALSINMIAGLQAALDAKLNRSGGTITGALTVSGLLTAGGVVDNGTA